MVSFYVLRLKITIAKQVTAYFRSGICQVLKSIVGRRNEGSVLQSNHGRIERIRFFFCRCDAVFASNQLAR